MYEFLQDKLFLNQLDNLRVKEQFVRITVLSWKEDPIQEIQGKVISGSLNLDGNSSLRRTANLTVFAEELVNDLTEVDDLLSINRKIKLEMGIKNTVPNYTYDAIQGVKDQTFHYTIDYKKEYGNIIWFPLGIFVIFDPNITHSTAGVNISLTLKDKMCLLNGDAGGVIPAAVEFHTKDQEGEDGTYYIDNPTIKQIIMEVVNHWGEEAMANIIISDVDERIKQVVQWSGDTPLYYVKLSNETGETMHSYYIDYASALDAAEGHSDAITSYEAGQDVGFFLTDFTYPGELVGDVGQTVTGVLDQIVQLLGNYEYFYDVYGRFRFQEIKNYLNTTYTSYQSYEANHGINKTPAEILEADAIQDYTIDLSGGMSVYTFEGTKLVNSFSNAPLYSNIKNDYVVWGVRTDTLGNQVPIRYHLAIDKKPQKTLNIGTDANPEYVYGEHQGISLYTDEFGVVRARSYVMVFNNAMNFPREGHDDRFYYDINNNQYYAWDNKNGKYYPTTVDMGQTIYSKDWREELYYQGLEAWQTGTDFPYYYTELIEELPKIYDLEKQEFVPAIAEDPSSIDFYLDIIDSDADVGKYNVQNIGRRSIAVSEDGINCVFEQEVPDIVFIDNELDSEQQKRLREECNSMGQAWAQVTPTIYDLMIMGGWQNSAYQRVCEMLYQYTNMNNSITISALPIYYLEPNTRITVNDPASGIYGDFMIQTISIPFDVNSMMSITASKALQKI